MRRVWVTKKDNRVVTLFFCGWGMDERAVRHLTGGGDLLVFYDYRDLSGEEAPLLDAYESVRVVAWSMGVWAASVLLGRWNVPVSGCVAINGTERPVDERCGIHPKVYALTERGMTEQGRDKFFTRMLAGEGEIGRFERNKPRRDLEEQREELRLIREQSAREMPGWKWDRAYVSAGDVIFPAANQREWWKERCEVVELTGGHYPFYVLNDWDLI